MTVQLPQMVCVFTFMANTTSCLFWCQFYEARSFYKCRSQKHKKDLRLVLFALLESLRVKALSKMLVKLTPPRCSCSSTSRPTTITTATTTTTTKPCLTLSNFHFFPTHNSIRFYTGLMITALWRLSINVFK